MAYETAADVISDAALRLGLVSAAISDPYASSDANILQLNSLLNAAGRELVRAHNWSQLRGTYTFPTVDGTQTYDLPTGFSRFVPDSVWDRTLDNKGVPISEAEYQRMAAIGTVGNHPFTFFLKLNQFHIYPVPTSVRTIGYGFHTEMWAAGTTEPLDDRADTNTDKIWFDAELITRLLIVKHCEAKGKDTGAPRSDYETYLSQAKSQDGAPPVLNITPPRNRSPLDIDANVPDGSWTL